MPKFHIHPMNPSQVVYGEQLNAGDVIGKDDVCDSTSGRWEKAPCAGLVLQSGCQTFWVRKMPAPKDWKIDWKEQLWDKLSDLEIRAIIESLPEAMQAEIIRVVSNYLLKRAGWVEVCAGCGKNPYDCGCPAGTAWRPPKK